MQRHLLLQSTSAIEDIGVIEDKVDALAIGKHPIGSVQLHAAQGDEHMAPLLHRQLRQTGQNGIGFLGAAVKQRI